MPRRPATTATLHDRTLDAIPGYRHAENRHNRLNALYKLVPTAHDAFGTDYLDRIAAAADAGVDSLDDLAAAHAADRATWARNVEFYSLVFRAREYAHNSMIEAERTGATEALDFLRSELDKLMADVDKHRSVIAAHPNTIEQAVRSGNLDDWDLVTSLLDRYTELRAEHRRYVRFQRGGDDIPDIVFVGQCMRFLEVDPYWRMVRGQIPGHNSIDSAIAGWFDNREIFGEQRRSSVWPTDQPRNEWLLTVADNSPWLPDAVTVSTASNLANQLFLGAKSYRNSVEVKGFWRMLDKLAALGVTTAITPAPVGG